MIGLQHWAQIDLYGYCAESWAPRTTLSLSWWVVLSIVQFLNVFLLYKAAQHPAAGSRKMVCWAAVFVTVCAVRAIWPRIDVERVCFWDTWVSVPFVGRSLATIAELCFVKQIVILLSERNLAPTFVKWALPVLSIAEVCSWAGVLSTNQLFNAVEESLWTMTMGVFMAFSCARTYLQARAGSVPLRSLLLNLDNHDEQLCVAYWCGVFGLSFLCFMVAVDVPMYYARWNSLQSLNGEPQDYLTIAEGISDSLSCKIVSRAWDAWREDVPWMSLYFSVCCWISIRMVLPASKFVLVGAVSPRLKDIAVQLVSDSKQQPYTAACNGRVKVA